MTETNLNVVGQSVLRRDGMGHVLGQTVYTEDINFPDLLHLKMVRSPVPHALIKGVDFSEAEKVPGFVRAITYKDVPKNIYTILCLIGVEPDEEPVLAEDRVLYQGRADRRHHRRDGRSCHGSSLEGQARPGGAACSVGCRGGAKA